MFFSTVQGLLPYSSSNWTVAVKKNILFSFHVSVNCHTFCISWHADHARALRILMLLLAILIYEPKLLTSSTAFIILLLMLTNVSRFNVAINLLLTFRRRPTFTALLFNIVSISFSCHVHDEGHLQKPVQFLTSIACVLSKPCSIFSKWHMHIVINHSETVEKMCSA